MMRPGEATSEAFALVSIRRRPKSSAFRSAQMLKWTPQITDAPASAQEAIGPQSVQGAAL